MTITIYSNACYGTIDTAESFSESGNSALGKTSYLTSMVTAMVVLPILL